MTMDESTKFKLLGVLSLLTTATDHELLSKAEEARQILDDIIWSA